jgi:hypothetical protein
VTSRRVPRLLAVVGLLTLSVNLVISGPAKASEPFVNGSGRADARIIRVGPSRGLSLAPTIGLSLSDFLGTLGRGQAITADFAALDGSIPPELAEQLPSVRAESTEEGAGQPETTTLAGSPAGVPVQLGAAQLSATGFKDPKGTSSFTLGALNIPGVIEVSGGTAGSSAAVIDKRTREAVGTSTIGTVKLAGGVVTLKGLKWQALQRTGANAGTEAEFTIEGATVPGVLGPKTLPIPEAGASLASLIDPINAALKPSGLVLRAPVKSTTNGVARIGPLAVTVADSEIGRTVLGPTIEQIQPVREPVTRALISADPLFSTAILLTDVTVGVLAGASRLDIELGGASAFTEGTSFVSPFGAFSLGAFTLPPSSGSPSDMDDTESDAEASTRFALSETRDFASGSGGLDSIGTTPPAGTTATADIAEARTASPTAASRTIPGTTGGPAALVGLAGLLAALGVAGADYRRIRNNRRAIVVA